MMSVAIPARPLLKRVRSGNLFSKHGSTALDAAERGYARTEARSGGFERGAGVTEMSLRRDSDYDDDAADGDEPEFSGRARRQSVRLNFDGGLMPKTLWGRIAAGGGLLCVALAAVAGGLWVRSYLLHDAHFVVPGSESIQIAGNSHVSRPQLLSVFGEDVDRNIFNIPLAVRRGELESLPWVEHATGWGCRERRAGGDCAECDTVFVSGADGDFGWGPAVGAGGADEDLPGLCCGARCKWRGHLAPA